MTNLQTLKQNQRPISQPRTGEIFHLRSLGHLEEALDIAKEDYENFPTDKRVNSAYYWYNPQNESCAASKTKRSVVGAFPKNEMVANRTI